MVFSVIVVNRTGVLTMEEAIGSNDVVNTMDWTGDQRGVVGYSWDTLNNERRLGCWGSDINSGIYNL